MMRPSIRLLALPALVSALVAPPAEARGMRPGQAEVSLQALLAREWEWTMAQDPLWASSLGDRRFNGRWTDLSVGARAARTAHQRKALAALRAIPRANLPVARQLDHQLYERELTTWLATDASHRDRLPVSHQGGVQLAHEIAEQLRFTTAQDYADWTARLHAVPAMVDQTIALMEEGRREGLVPPRVIMTRVLPQLAAQVPAKATDSPFYAPFEQAPAGIPARDFERLKARGELAIAHDVIPAYRRFQTYFAGTYLPAATATTGLWALPGGPALYAHLARTHTTTTLAPSRLHQLGLAEVARIRQEMEGAKAKAGFTGTLEQFFAAVKADPRFKRTDEAAYLAEYRALAKRLDPLLLKLFRKMPRTPYGVEPIPALSAPNVTAAYYVPPAADGSRAGTFFVNTYKLENRPAYEMVPLTLHEAVPGHHFQIALQQELGELPAFRRNGGYTAYIEGWGLYSESLGRELGLYDDPYVYFGKLNMEMRRALRVVLDTGLHAERWDRDRAIAFFKANAAKSEMEIINEVDRYLGDPGQALAYKVGELKIQELRARATARLGGHFDLKDFHELVLRDGALPLDVLETRADAWIAARSVKFPQPAAVAGFWTMKLTIGTKVFKDEIALKRGADGAFGGTLQVVGRWRAPLENVVLSADRLAFEVMAPEGKVPFRVRYEGTVSTDGQRFVGQATMPTDATARWPFEATNGPAR